jgi:hypothetical protein
MENVGIFYEIMKLWTLSLFCGNVVYFMVVLYIFSRFGMTWQKNLATLAQMHAIRHACVLTIRRA